MAKRCMGGYTTTREVYKTVKKYDHQQFDAFCTRVYTNGFNDGKKSVTEKPVRTITDGSYPFEKGRTREKDLDFDAFMYRP